MRNFTVMACMLFSIQAFSQPSLKFVEEYIDFKLDEQKFEINGVYLFYNSSERKMVRRIEFPFATFADSVEVLRVYDINKNKLLTHKSRGKSIFFTIEIEPRDTLSVNIAYRQPTHKENVYILTSTQAWKAPLEKVRYTFQGKENITIRDFSYQYDSVSDDRIYRWEKLDFMPDRNFIVTTD